MRASHGRDLPKVFNAASPRGDTASMRARAAWRVTRTRALVRNPPDL